MVSLLAVLTSCNNDNDAIDMQKELEGQWFVAAAKTYSYSDDKNIGINEKL
jgi:hypothetical protein